MGILGGAFFFFFLRDYPKTRAEGVISLGNCQKKKKKRLFFFFFFFLRDYPKTRAEGVISLGNCQKKKKKKKEKKKAKKINACMMLVRMTGVLPNS